MSGFDGNGNFDLAHDFTDERDAGTKILASQVDTMFGDIKTGLESTLTKNGATGAASVLDVDNIKIDGNTISSTNTNGDINITPNGTGSAVVSGILDADNIRIDGNTVSSTDTNGDINLTPNGDGSTIIDTPELTIPTTGGSVNAYTTNFTRVDGRVYPIKSHIVNTSSVTVDTKALVDKDGNALSGGEFSGTHNIEWDNGNDRYILLDPEPIESSYAIPGSNFFFGDVNSNGTSAYLPTSWSSSRSSLGTYLVTHNLNTTDIIVVVSPFTPNNYRATFNVSSVNAVQIDTNDNSGNQVDSRFNFFLFKR